MNSFTKFFKHTSAAGTVITSRGNNTTVLQTMDMRAHTRSMPHAFVWAAVNVIDLSMKWGSATCRYTRLPPNPLRRFLDNSRSTIDR